MGSGLRFARLAAGRRLFSCTNFPATRAAGTHRSVSFPATIAARFIARAAIRRRMCRQASAPMIKSARPRTWPTWCVRCATVRLTSSGSPWAALPRCIWDCAIRNSSARWLLPGLVTGRSRSNKLSTAPRSKRDADHAEAIGMAAFARNLAASHYAQCLRAKDETAWLRFAERLAEHSVIGMAMTLRGVLATRPSLWHLADRLRGLDRPVLLVAGDEDTPCLEPSLFLEGDAARCCVLRHAAYGTSDQSGRTRAVQHDRYSVFLWPSSMAAGASGRAARSIGLDAMRRST